MATSFTLNPRAASGFQNASNYDAHRPSYSAEAVDKLLTHLGVANQKNARIIDLACGTGKFTELLAEREEDFEVVGIEPHAGMREELMKKELRGVTVQDGDAGHMAVEDEWGDALIAAQAFHWFATEESLKEIHRVLRPGATLGLIWNIEDCWSFPPEKAFKTTDVTDNSPKDYPATTNWEQKLKDIIAAHEDGHPRFRHMAWKHVFEKQQDTTPLQTLKDTFFHHMPTFSLPLGEENVKWTVWLSDEALWSRFATISHIANLEEGKKEEVRNEVYDALKRDGVERNAEGEVALHGVTYLAWTSRV